MPPIATLPYQEFNEHPCFYFSKKALAKKVTFFQSNLGEIIYPVKVNPHPLVLQSLYDLGIKRFDVSNFSELQRLSQILLKSDNQIRIFFTHPVKSMEVIEAAWRDYGVRDYVVDHPLELVKITNILRKNPTHQLFNRNTPPTIWVRITIPESNSITSPNITSPKFGCDTKTAIDLIENWVKNPISVKFGITFHVGSQKTDPKYFSNTILMANEILEHLHTHSKVSPHAFAGLDIGGGFPINYHQSQPTDLQYYIANIRHTIDHQPHLKSVTLFCEPGRALVAEAISLVSRVELVKPELKHIYINNGLYYHFPELITNHFTYPIRCYSTTGLLNHSSLKHTTYTIFGNSCDNLDRLPLEYLLPNQIKIGDSIVFDKMGAYHHSPILAEQIKLKQITYHSTN